MVAPVGAQYLPHRGAAVLILAHRYRHVACKKLQFFIINGD